MNPTTPKVVTVNESDLECPLCRDILFEPYTIQKCSHTICGLCVQLKEYKIAYVHGSLEPRQCPFCRVDLGAMPVVYRNLFLAGLCESSYWNLPEHNDKRREKQAEFDRLRAERKREGEAAKREREQAQRKRSFTEFKAELNKLITYRGDILDPESAKKMRTFVDEEMRMLSVEGPAPPPPPSVESVWVNDPYSREQLTQIKEALLSKIRDMTGVQTESYMRGFLYEISEQVHQLTRTVCECLTRARLPVDESTLDPDSWRVKIGRAAASSWLLATFPFVRLAHPPRAIRPDVDDDTHRRRVEEKKAPVSQEQVVQIAAYITSNWNYDKRLHTDSYMEAYLSEIESRVPGVFELLSNDICAWVPGPSNSSPAIQQQSRVLGRNAAEYVLSKYLRPSSRIQQQV